MQNPRDRLKSNIKISEAGCWIWQRQVRLGYGRMHFNGKLEQAHRVAFKIFRGDIPKGLQINHKCHNSLCVNPKHLYAGTQKQNMEDKVRAGRENWAVGERCKNAKLNKEKVLLIREQLKYLKPSVVCKIYKVSINTILDVDRGRTWKHIK